MEVSFKSPVDHHGLLSSKRMHIGPMLPGPVNYESAAIPTYAPFGTEYTPEHTLQIVAGRPIAYPRSNVPTSRFLDPDLAPTKTIQNAHAMDHTRWSHPSKSRFDTTYRTEFINRLRHSDHYNNNIRHGKAAFNQYSVLPPISTRTNPIINGSRAENQQEVKRPSPEPSIQQMKSPPKPPVRSDDIYLPNEPVLLTDYEEQRLADQIRVQLTSPTIIDRLKIFYQELTAYDPERANSVHYSTIQQMANQLGINIDNDTLRFTMCKFVSPNRPRGYVNYEDMIRYFGKCLSSVYPNQYGSREYEHGRYWISRTIYHDLIEKGLQANKRQVSVPTGTETGRNSFNASNEDESFDPDERRIRILLKQNFKEFDVNGGIDFDKLNREFNQVDRDRTGILSRQQIEEVVYRVRIPLQRTIIYEILEKHCKAYSKLYRWQSFVRYLQEQIFDLKQVEDRSSPVYTKTPTRQQWLDEMRMAHSETDRLQIIERYITKNEGPRLESNQPHAWFTRFLRLANAIYTHRANNNQERNFILPREEARRVFQAYNQIWDLRIDENQLQRVFDNSTRNGNVSIDTALKLLAQ